jgi:preprotein translocase subunit SecD
MIRNLPTRIILILFIVAISLWIDFSNEIRLTNPIDDTIIFVRNTSARLGLDLQGGLQVLLEADLPETTAIDAGEMETARSIVENRTNALGVSENLIQVAGDRRIVGEFPGAEDADAILDIIQQTGLLEFVDTGDYSPDRGTILQTDYGITPVTATPPPAEGEAPDTVYHTIMTGGDLRSIAISQNQFGGTYAKRNADR